MHHPTKKCHLLFRAYETCQKILNIEKIKSDIIKKTKKTSKELINS
ncbi:hypothetical protein MNB_SV-12-102 [hydrothermal vent metagenome]|uniref:Uncharacterized protein n=1 Tax=hydrothermal vent metagenome TaxID=652676 RepID=A0A1W1BGU1_9ZZZZ